MTVCQKLFNECSISFLTRQGRTSAEKATRGIQYNLIRPSFCLFSHAVPFRSIYPRMPRIAHFVIYWIAMQIQRPFLWLVNRWWGRALTTSESDGSIERFHLVPCTTFNEIFATTCSVWFWRHIKWHFRLSLGSLGSTGFQNFDVQSGRRLQCPLLLPSYFTHSIGLFIVSYIGNRSLC